jgi:uncharacterized protein (TIGR02147 family)
MRCIINLSMTPVPYYRKRIQEELSRRIEKNSRYSLRALAKALKIESTALSQILSGKRLLSEKKAAHFFSILGFAPEEQQAFLLSLAQTKKRMGLKRIDPSLRTLLLAETTSIAAPDRELSLDLFRIIADWYHYAILELTFVKGFQSNPRWVASKLGLGISEVNLAVERMVSLELLKIENGKWIKSAEQLNTADKAMTTVAHRKHQKQILEKSIHSLENDPIEKRKHSSMTFAIDESKMNEAKNRIEKFIGELTDFLETGERTRVYELSVNLFPIQLENKI